MSKPDGGVRKLGIRRVLDRLIQQAVMQVLHRWVVDLDLEKFFDRGQSRQTDGGDGMASNRQESAPIDRSIPESGGDGEWAGESGEEGTPQGGPLSPLISNTVLDELDRELERRKHRFVRDADDCNIYVRSRRTGQRVMNGVTGFLARRLKLKVNEAKSAVARPEERKFLGVQLIESRII
jgi:RNA-directed DNA polymerase